LTAAMQKLNYDSYIGMTPVTSMSRAHNPEDSVIQPLQQEETRVLYPTEQLLVIDKDIPLTGLSVKPL